MKKVIFIFTLSVLHLTCDVSKLSVQDEIDFLPIKINDRYFVGEIKLSKLEHLEGYRLSVISQEGVTNDLHIKFPVYRFEAADINEDGRTDVLLGVIKSTHFHPEIEKRLFAFKLDSGVLRPLWLGSKVCQTLIDFQPRYINNRPVILTIEKGKDNNFYNGLYKWQDFGFQLIEYKNKTPDYSSALTYFENEIQ